MCEKNGLDNVTLIQAAVGDREGEIEIGDCDEHEANSIVRGGSGVRVKSWTLDSLMRSLGITEVSFLKMNIEGAERLALAGMAEMARQTKCVCISCHDFLANEGGPNELRTKTEVVRFLQQNGFAVVLRDSDARCNVRDFVYGLNEALVKH